MPVAAVGAAGLAYTFVYKEDIKETTGLSETTEKVTSSSHGYDYFITSLVEKENKKVFTDIPEDFVGSGENDNVYACRIELQENITLADGTTSTKSNFVDDHTCAVFRLDNFDKEGSKTLNLPLNTDSSMLFREKTKIEESHQQLLRVNKKFRKQFTNTTTSIAVVKKGEVGAKPTTYFELKLDFPFELTEPKSIPSRLVSAWLKEKMSRPTGAASLSAETPLRCQLGLEGYKYPCKIYKHQNLENKSTFTSEDLKKIEPITDYTNHVKEENYYVVDFLKYRKTFTQLSNLEINVFEKQETSNTDYLIMTFIYDRNLFGKYKTPNNHTLYFQSPERRVYLAKKTEIQASDKLSSPAITTTAGSENYKCKLMPEETKKYVFVENLDTSCRLYKLPEKDSNAKSILLTDETFKDLKDAPSSFDNDNFFKLEVDSTRMFNLNPDIHTAPNQKVRILALEKQTSDNAKKFYGELEIVKEFTNLPEKLVGNAQLILVQARYSGRKFQNTSGKTIKCKFYEASDPFDCDFYSPNNQLQQLLDVNTKTGLEKIDLAPAKREDFSTQKTFKQKQHFIVDLKKPIPMEELFRKKQIFYVYQHASTGSDTLPGAPSATSSSSSTSTTTAGKAQCSTSSTSSSSSSSSSSGAADASTCIELAILKVLEGNPKASTPPVILN